MTACALRKPDGTYVPARGRATTRLYPSLIAALRGKAQRWPDSTIVELTETRDMLPEDIYAAKRKERDKRRLWRLKWRLARIQAEIHKMEKP